MVKLSELKPGDILSVDSEYWGESFNEVKVLEVYHNSVLIQWPDYFVGSYGKVSLRYFDLSGHSPW